MNPEQPGAPDSGNNYDFILNPDKPPAPKAIIGMATTKNPFIMRLAFIIGGAVVLMIVVAVAINLFFGSKTNLDDLVSITQSEQEIVRLSGQGSKAEDQLVKNAAINTELSVRTQQRVWLAFLTTYGRTVSAEELILTKDPTVDKRLTSAKQTSTFDSTFSAIVRSELEEYAVLLKNAYSRATGERQRSTLKIHYEETQLLLKQWPESS